MKTVVVVNPKSANGRTGARWPELERQVASVLGPIESQFTSAPGDGTRLCRAALDAGADRVIAVGGDGTINEVVNGFFDGERRVAPKATFAILPSGSGGDFIRSVGIPRDFDGACNALRQPARPIDVGRMRYVDHAGNPALRYFINIGSFGMAGLVDHFANRTSKALGGTVSFMAATLRAALNYKTPEVRVALDDGAAAVEQVYNIAVANGRFFGGGMKVAPGAELDDGFFDVIFISDLSFTQVLRHGIDLYSGAHIHHPKVRVVRAKKVVAEAVDGAAEVLIDCDGEQPGKLPVTFELVAHALEVHTSS